MKAAIVSGKSSKKSKRRSFRPIGRPKNPRPEEPATAAPTRSEPTNSSVSLPNEPNSDHNTIDKPLEQTAESSTALVEHSGTVTTPVQDEEIHVSLPDEDKKQAALSNLPLELVPPVIPENVTGKPLLKSFCTFPRRKRTKKANEAATQPSQAVVEAQQEVDAASEINTPTGPAVQIINGELVLQESSMICQNTTGKNLQNTAMTVVEEEAETAIVNATYTSFATGRRARAQTAQWNPEETQLFYEALRQVGLDFSSMESYFGASDHPNVRKRDRRQLKRKYQRENATNPELVERALMPSKRVKIDLSVFELTKQAVLDYKETEEADSENETTNQGGIASTNATGDSHMAASQALQSTNSDTILPTAPAATETAVPDKEPEKDAAEEVDPILLDDDHHAATTEGETTLSLGGLSKKKKATKSKRPRVHRPRKTPRKKNKN